MVARGEAITARFFPGAGRSADAALILAHGAGAGQRSPFMTAFAEGLSGLGLDAVTFNFLYTEQKRRVPDKAAALESCYRAVIDAVATRLDAPARTLFIGGKSMGGRIATQVAAADTSLPVAGLVLLGYPLHPPGRPEQRRDQHLASVKRPMLFVQGERDTFGTPSELASALTPLDPPATLEVVQRGDHSFKVPGAGAREQAVIYDRVQRTIAEWISARLTAAGAR